MSKILNINGAKLDSDCINIHTKSIKLETSVTMTAFGTATAIVTLPENISSTQVLSMQAYCLGSLFADYIACWWASDTTIQIVCVNYSSETVTATTGVYLIYI